MDAIKEAMIREEDTGERNPALDPYRAKSEWFTESQVYAALRAWWDVPTDETLIDHVKGDQRFLEKSLSEMRAALDAAYNTD